MQPRANGSTVRALPKIWGAFLCYQLGTDSRGLDCTLTNRPDGHKFKFGVNPRPIPLKGAPRVFQRVLEDGHWPDISAYRENDLDGTFNLLRRVAVHIPGSQDWLFADLKRIAQQQPLDEMGIQDSIGRILDRFGLTRLDPKVAYMILTIDGNTDFEISPRLFETHWESIAAFGEPLHVSLLTLLMAEWRCYGYIDALAQIYPYCARAWAQLLRRPELATDRKIQIVAICACRHILAQICFERPKPAGPLMEALRRHNPFCPIWAPDHEAVEAEKRLGQFQVFMQQERSRERRVNPPSPLAQKQKARALPPEVERDVEIVCRRVLDSRFNWSTWTREMPADLSPEESELIRARDHAVPV